VKLAVVIVTYRTKELVQRCVESVKADLPSGLPAHLIVVDNASGDGTVELFREKYPEVEVIANQGNRGPAYAYNQGIRAASGDEYVMMLNSDIELQSGTIPPMLDYLEAHPEVHGVLGRLLNPDGTPQYMRVQIKQWRKPDWSQEFRATFVSTCFLMARQTAFAKVGLFDEAYYFHNEDLDWSERAQRLGLVFRNLPQVAVYHHCSAGKKQNFGPITTELYPSNLYYFHKFYGPTVARLAMWVLLLEIRQSIRRLTAELSQAQDPEERARREDSIKHLKAGRAKMLLLARSGKLPRWRPEDAPER
jgi:GT2 family glycosyltransferase